MKPEIAPVAICAIPGWLFQMGVIILIGTFAGKKLDAYFQWERPYMTILLSLLSIAAALYITLKDLISNESK